VKLYRTKFQLRSATISRWQADTLFGHLCWSLVRRKGEPALREFLQLYESRQPPVVLSDGFPADYLPRPKLPRIATSKTDDRAVWLTLTDFNSVRCGQAPSNPRTPANLADCFSERLQPKNQIDRLTGTTGGEAGQLYELMEIRMREVMVYWKIADGWQRTVEDFLFDLAQTGFGKRKSIGYGQIESGVTLELFDEGFEAVPKANGFVTLSRFVPHEDDPTDGCWETAAKYGKLGEEFATLTTPHSPFKKPLIQLVCGSCFRDGQPREWYGRLIDKISTIEAVRHYALAFALPLRWPSE
jgi:CRISPR-associated protein Csm4